MNQHLNHTRDHPLTISARRFPCGDSALIVECGCGFVGVAEAFGGGCGDGHIRLPDGPAPVLDELHRALVGLLDGEKLTPEIIQIRSKHTQLN